MQSLSHLIRAREAQNVLILQPCKVVESVIAHMAARVGAVDEKILAVDLTGLSLFAPVLDAENRALEGALFLGRSLWAARSRVNRCIGLQTRFDLVRSDGNL